MVQRPDQNGQLSEAAREVREQTKAGDKVTSNTAHYEPDYTGKMSLIRQQVDTTSEISRRVRRHRARYLTPPPLMASPAAATAPPSCRSRK